MGRLDIATVIGIAIAVSTDGATEKRPNTSETTMANIITPIVTTEIAETVTKDGAANGGGKTAMTAVKAQFHIPSQARSCFRACFFAGHQCHSHPYKDDFPPANSCRR